MKLVLFTVLASVALACSSGQGGIDVAGHDVAGHDTAVADTATPDASADPGTDPSVDPGADATAPDAAPDGAPDVGVDTAVDTAVDTEPDLPPADVVDPCQGAATPGDLPVGWPCTAHDQCVTGYCYDEAWKDAGDNAGFRFCTIGCTSCSKPCSEWESLSASGNTCLIFLAAEINEHALDFKSLCMPTCTTDAECEAASGGLLTACRTPLHWNGDTIGLKKVCFP